MQTIPTFEEFLAWSGEQVAPYMREKVVLFSPGGSSRWYFHHYGDPAKGYDDPAIFLDYSQRGLYRSVEIANMMFDDGIRTVFLVAIMPAQLDRSQAYSQNLARSIQLLADDEAEALYAQYGIGVRFRGKWDVFFEQLGNAGFWRRCQELEARSIANCSRWLIWTVQEDFLPSALAPLIRASLEAQGTLPDQKTLAEAYYGRPLTQIDLYIGHNKPSLTNQIPPLLSVGDLYFTATPSYDLDQYKWRLILYDHLFSRKGNYRDYTKIESSAMEDFGQYYEANQDLIIGVGMYHAPTQTWRPIQPPSLRSGR